MQPTAPLQRSLRRLALTTKQGPHNYYKGNRTGAMGRHTKWGGYVLDYTKVRTFVCPDLTDFNMTPFVTEKRYCQDKTTDILQLRKTLTPERYLRAWKFFGGEQKSHWRS